MPKRKIVLAEGEVYHLFNKTIANQPVFTSKREIDRALRLLNYYRFRQPVRYSHYQDFSLKKKKDYLSRLKKTGILFVEVYAFALVPNHFHLLAKQISDNGISSFVANVQNSFAKYFNLKNNRSGSLFQNMFRAVRIENDEQLTHVSRYIHLNPVTSFLMGADDLPRSLLTSFPYYIRPHSAKRHFWELVSTDLILGLFGTRKRYQKFVFDQVDYQRRLQEIKSLALE